MKTLFPIIAILLLLLVFNIVAYYGHTHIHYCVHEIRANKVIKSYVTDRVLQIDHSGCLVINKIYE
jgi:hypothetical protein